MSGGRAWENAAGLGSAAKGHIVATHRTIAPEDTEKWLRGLMEAMGITRVADITGLDEIGVPVVMVCRPASRALAVSQGKGLTRAAAAASGLMESAESFHAEHVRLPLLHASWEEIAARQPVVDVERLPKRAGSRFHASLRTLWLEGMELNTGGPAWLPYECVHTDFTIEPLPGEGSFIRSSNGLAGGNHRLEALSHALCEVIERDAETLWELLPKPARDATRVDLDTVGDAGCIDLLARCRRAGLAVAVWEMTQDVLVPSFRCRLAPLEPNPLRPMSAAEGSGCHPDRVIALLRALTEAVQSRLTLIAGTREDAPASRYVDVLHPESVAWAAGEMTGGGHRVFADGCGWHAARFEEDVARELAALASAGMESAVGVDLTLPELGIPVVRVVVPGLEAGAGQPLGERARRLLGGTR